MLLRKLGYTDNLKVQPVQIILREPLGADGKAMPGVVKEDKECY